MAKPEPSGTCENCLKELTIGQVVLIYDDVELHADCDAPYKLQVEENDECPAPSILLGDPLLSFPLSAVLQAGKKS